MTDTIIKTGMLFLLTMIIILVIITIIEIHVLYTNADEVKCDIWGNCIFTTTFKNITITKECYENGELINCSNDNYDKYRGD